MCTCVQVEGVIDAESACMSADDLRYAPSVDNQLTHLRVVSEAAAAAAAAAALEAAAAAGGGGGGDAGPRESQRWDLGLLLQGLLLRFGDVMGYDSEAVAVNRGNGIIAKPEAWSKAGA
jgi:hypothetical protein